MNDLHPIAIPTPFPVGPVNVYLLDGPAPTLVDAGPNTDEALATLRVGLAAHGCNLADVRHLLRDISSNPILEPPLPGEAERPHSLAQYLRSLERVAALEIEVAWPGHGAPITDPRGLIARRVRFHRRRAEQIAAVLVEGPQTAFQIATAFFPALRGIEVLLAVSEVIGHLDILEEEGRVGVQQEEGIVLYALTDRRE